jgi:3',5'-cyclic AMP phosphodiesterase CpdA
MTRIVHISDLHFGALDPATLDPLRDAVAGLGPALIVVSGDLTQRARPAQFEAAKAFLRTLAAPRVLCVPGNHDVPLWNLLRRTLAPLRHYRRHIDAELYPTWIDDEVALIGINTARSATIANGRVNHRQLQRIARFLDAEAEGRCRIVVAHHPFALPEDSREQRVGRSRRSLAALVDARVDLLLTGHRHRPWVRALEPGPLTIHAGTATSARRRGEPNSFMVLDLSARQARIERWDWRPADAAFAPESAPAFDGPLRP